MEYSRRPTVSIITKDKLKQSLIFSFDFEIILPMWLPLKDGEIHLFGYKNRAQFVGGNNVHLSCNCRKSFFLNRWMNRPWTNSCHSNIILCCFHSQGIKPSLQNKTFVHIHFFANKNALVCYDSRNVFLPELQIS